MNHDTEAAYASSEVADLIMRNQEKFFGDLGEQGSWSVFAGRESEHKWPLADGVIHAQNKMHDEISIAFEYKRPNEGVHGILTALGQSFAYLEKGYDASVMVIPAEYSSHSNPGEHIKNIIDSVVGPDSSDIPISVYTYTTPDHNAIRPFSEKLTCVRDISLPTCRELNRNVCSGTQSKNISTLWAHVREGMSHPDAYYRYCQAVKILSSKEERLDDVKIPEELINAVHSINPNENAFMYLSHTSGDSLSDKAWRYVWFHFYFWNDMMPIYSSHNPYVVNKETTKIRIDDGKMQTLFVGTKKSKKNEFVESLNNQSKTEDTVWREYAKKIRNYAHSYREVIDSGLYHIGFLEGDGSLTELGYKFVNACERIDCAYKGVPFEILKAAMLQNGQYAAMLHYIYKLSEEKFSEDPLAFVEKKKEKYSFKSDEYLKWLIGKFTDDLHLVLTSADRGGEAKRKPFQAEFWMLKKMGFVKSKGRNNTTVYRIGLGLEINWSEVENSIIYFQNL